MKIAIAKLESISAYSASAPIVSTKNDKEHHDEYDLRVWRERLNVCPDGTACIPAQSFSLALVAVSKLLQESIKGKKGQTWTKHFSGGVLITEPLRLEGVTRENVACDKRFVPSDGKPGGGSRVWRHFPIVPNWSGEITAYIVNDFITTEIFERYLSEAGNLIGVGRFRPQNRGFYGRFKATKVSWK